MLPSQARKDTGAVGQLLLGPLRYALVPHDPWGEAVVAAIERHLLPAEAFADTCERTVHLCRFPAALTCSEHKVLPAALLARLPPGLAEFDWQCHNNELNSLWLAPDTRHVIWTATADAGLGNFRYHLPWNLILEDITARGGGLIHGGLVVREGHGLLFLAPPGGGKTTTLGTAPAGWQVLADDAALVWPREDSSWMVSPMPTWSMLIGTSSLQPPGARLATAATIPLRTLLMLHKAERVSLGRLAAGDAAPLLYRGLREYPGSLLGGDAYRERLFRTAARMARGLPAWRLGLPKHADIWQRLIPIARGQHDGCHG